MVPDTIDGYSSDSSGDDYYLCDDPKEYSCRKNIRRLLSMACEFTGAGGVGAPSPNDIADFLNEMNGICGFTIPVDLENIKNKIGKADKKRKNFVSGNASDESIGSPVRKKMKNCSSSQEEERQQQWTQKKNRSVHKRTLRASLFQKHVLREDQETSYSGATSSDAGSPSGVLPEVVVGGGGGGVVVDDFTEGWVLVFRKELTGTDASNHHNRLLIPRSKLLVEFLTWEEEERLTSKVDVVPAKLIGTRGEEYDVSLRRNGKRSDYTIAKPWNDIRRNDGLIEGSAVELWARRRNGSDLWLNLRGV